MIMEAQLALGTETLKVGEQGPSESVIRGNAEHTDKTAEC